MEFANFGAERMKFATAHRIREEAQYMKSPKKMVESRDNRNKE
jgi:hypothetical protein